MLTYLIRRLLSMIPILLGVMVITFLLFYQINRPETMARQILGPKADQRTVETWLAHRGYDKPIYLNTRPGEPLLDSQFFNTLKGFLTFDLGISDYNDEPVAKMIRRGILPSLLITLPAFIVGFSLSLLLSLFQVFIRDSLLDRWGTAIFVALMSIPVIVYVIFGQWIAANLFAWFPAFGFNFEGLSTARFLALPVLIMVLSGLGSEVRLYRAIFIEEIRADYIRTAQAKGVSHARVLLVHVLKNGLIALITVVVASLPFLIMGSLVVESFFGIPGLGNLMMNAINTSDFSLIRANVYIGSLLFLFGLMLTDLCYAAADPRIRLQ